MNKLKPNKFKPKKSNYLKNIIWRHLLEANALEQFVVVLGMLLDPALGAKLLAEMDDGLKIRSNMFTIIETYDWNRQTFC